jgi:hypothetical protein
MLELQIRDGVGVANGLKSYDSTSGEGWDVVAGADHGQGAWRSYIKFFTEDTKWRCEQVDVAKEQRSSNQIRNGGYCIKQSARMECRKDTAGLLNVTVTKNSNEGYSSLICSRRLIAMSTGEKVQAVIISKHAIGMIAGKGRMARMCEVRNDTFITTAEDKLTLTGDDCTLSMLDILPKFNVFMTVCIAFYADVLGKANSSGYWCYLCQLSWAQWNACGNEEATKWTTGEFKQALHTKIETKADSVLGVKEEMHYKEISPQLFVCPPLHMEIGLVNKVW